MPQRPFIARLATLPRRRGFRVFAALWLAAVALLAALPTVGIPGYAHALGLTVLAGTLGLVPGVLAARVERAVSEPRPHRGVPPLLEPARTALGSVAYPFAVALFVLLVGLGLGLAASLGAGAVRGTCDLTADLRWYPVLPLPTALLSAAVGVFAGLAARRAWASALWLVGIVLASGVASAWPILTGPQVFGFNHFLGWIAGPLYDERVAVELPLLAFRALTLAWALVTLGVSAVLLDRETLRLGRPRFRGRRRGWLVAGFGLGAAALLLAHASDLGFRQSFGSVAEALGGERRTEHFVLHYPAERDAAWVEQAALDHEFRLRQVMAWLELDPSALPTIHSYVFRDREEKRRLTGAGRTSVAKPWLHAVFIDDRGLPHPVLKHELVHAVTASLGRGPFQVATSDGVVPNDGLVEGIAVAADWRPGELDVHAQARAMRDLGLAPDPRDLFRRVAFWRHAPARSYTLAGSFLRWLADTRGVEAVKAAYRAGDLSAVGDPDALFRAWGAFLDARPLGEAERRLAEARFRRPSVVHRACAFDVTRARERAQAARRAGRTDAALRWLDAAAGLEPQEPRHLADRLGLLLGAERWDEAAETARRLLDHPGADATLRMQAMMTLGDLAAREGALDRAARRFEAAEALGADPALDRAAAARLHVLGAGLAGPLMPFLRGEVPRVEAVLRLRDLAEAHPEDPLVPYLLGRQLQQAGASEAAIPWLERARDRGLPPDGGLAVENLRLLGAAARDAGRMETAEAAFAAMAQHPAATASERLEAADWLDRLAFERGAPERPAARAADPS